MNNPLQASVLPRSPTAGPPIPKKQRGGATPGSIRARPRPAVSQRQAPPLVDDAIARRRAELRRLQEKAKGSRRSAPPPTSSTAPPPRRSNLKAAAAPPKSPSQIPRPGPSAPSSPPKPNHSFPSKIPKSPPSSTKKSPTKSPSGKSPGKPPMTTDTISKLQLPGANSTAAAAPGSSTATSNTTIKANPNLPPETPLNTIPPTPAVGRRLEFPSNQKASHQPPQSKTKPPMVVSRARSKSPGKALAASNNKPSQSRARSAPPRRPPGPPPKGRSTSRPKPRDSKPSAAEKKAAEKRAARSRRPAPVRPGSLLPKDETKSKAAASGPPPTAASAPPAAGPPPAAKAAPPVGTGSLDTSNIDDAKLTETPKPQKSVVSGAETPPSSGSSARRKKLQLMREQAVVASSITKQASGPPPTTTSFYTGSGTPATAAFASAIAAPNADTAPPEVPLLVNEAKKGASSTSKPPLLSSSSAMPTSAAQARLEEAYQNSERDKIAALTKIKELEDKLSQATVANTERLQETQQQQKLDVRTLLDLAERSSNGGVLPTKPAASFGFQTGSSSEPYRKARMAIRSLRANNHTGSNADNESPELTERRLIRKFREAARYVAYEFSSDLATYTVRRPYGTPTAPGLFAHCRRPDEAENAYAKKAHVSDKTTVEVAAVTTTDRTPLLVFGTAGIRYQTNPSRQNQPPEWKQLDNVDALDRPLGHVTYIDNQGNEKEYSLDEVLEEALLVREQYCGTLTSTALALPDATSKQPPQQQPSIPKTDVGVGTDAPPSKQDPTKQQQQAQPPEPEPSSSSSDVLVVFLGMVVSFAFHLVWGVFIGMPVRIVRTTIVLVVASLLIQMLHLYLADGYNEWALREMVAHSSSVVASDLAFFSNKHPGIL